MINVSVYHPYMYTCNLSIILLILEDLKARHCNLI